MKRISDDISKNGIKPIKIIHTKEEPVTIIDNYYPQYLTTGAVARHCGVSKVTVLRWIEKGNLISFRLPGGQNRIHRDDFYTFAIKHKIPLRNGDKG